jgi:hypothetical protein
MKKSQPHLHEDLQRDHQVKYSSNRNFGLTFSTIFALLGLYKLYHQKPLGWLWILAALNLLLISFFWPAWLTGLNRKWSQFGLLLHKLTSPVIMGLLFFGVITPFGIVMRLFGFDPMKRKFDPQVKSYWNNKLPYATYKESMKNQF